MHSTLGTEVLHSDVSPATLDVSLSARSLGLHCVEDMLEVRIAGSSVDDFLEQKLRCLDGSHVLDVEPLGRAGAACRSSSRSV